MLDNNDNLLLKGVIAASLHADGFTVPPHGS
jgi:hypothetical protein